MEEKALTYLCERGVFSLTDIHFARFMASGSGDAPQSLSLASALVSSYHRQGHICIELPFLAGSVLYEDDGCARPVLCPDLDEWVGALSGIRVVGRPGEYKPLILDDQSRLYLYRYWEYQERLSRSILDRVHANTDPGDRRVLKMYFDRLFPGEAGDDIDWQLVAAFTALRKKFCVISGGPGTGKTTTMARILALLGGQTTKTRIALAAPTGKGAARLIEAIKQEKDRMDCPEHIKAGIPGEASTIHRLLGSVRGSPYFRFNARNPLPFETVVVDEASMVDLALMSKLVQALPRDSRLILSGDENQLASVEAGAVLGDICNRDKTRSYSGDFCRDLYSATGVSLTDTGNPQNAGLQDCIVRLRRNYRFRGDSGIGALCQAVMDGDVDRSFEILQDSRYDDVGWVDLSGPGLWAGRFKIAAGEGFGGYLHPEDPEETFQRFDRFRVLCAVREGPYGVISANRMVEDALKSQKWIQPDTPWYAGRPVMITRNDYRLRLFNGDVGMTLPDPEAVDLLRVVFFAPDGAMRQFHPVRLPDHETVFAMSVHKSQGSEFGEVLLVLPDRDSPVLTRELLYTGISRARNRVRIWGRKEVFKTAVSRRIHRMSGLRDALWGKADGLE